MKVIILSVTIFISFVIAYVYYKKSTTCDADLIKQTNKFEQDKQDVVQSLEKMNTFHKERYDKLMSQMTTEAVSFQAKQKESNDIIEGLTTKKYDGDWVLLGSKNRDTYIHIDGNNVSLIQGSELEAVSQAAAVSTETKGKLYGDSIIFETTSGSQLIGNVYLNPSKQLILEMNMTSANSSSRSVRIFNKLNHAVTCDKLVLYDDQKGSLNLAEIFVYDIMGGMVPLTSKNVSMVNPWDAYPISNIVDKNEDTFMHNANVDRKITLTFDKEVNVSIVVIRNRKDCCQTRANGLMLKLFSTSNRGPDTSLRGFDSTKVTSEQISGQTIYNYEKYSSYPVKDWSGSDVYENGGTNLNNPYAYNYIIFSIPNREPIISNKFVS